MPKLLDERTMARRIDRMVVKPILKLRIGHLLLSLAGKEMTKDEVAKTFGQLLGNYLLGTDFCSEPEESLLLVSYAIPFLQTIASVEDFMPIIECYAVEYHPALRVIGVAVYKGVEPNSTMEGRIALSILNI